MTNKLTTCTKMCKQCPWSSTSAPGWLGPHTVNDMLAMQQYETAFACHMQLGDEDDDGTPTGVDVCRGFLAGANKSFKLFGGRPVIGDELKRLQKQVSREGKEKPEDILSQREFQRHHATIHVMDYEGPRATNLTAQWAKEEEE